MDPRDVLTRAATRPEAVLKYGDHLDQLLDVHLPLTVEGPAPMVFLVHGGFWRQSHDRLHTRPMAQALTAAGWAVVSPEYRRTGNGGGWPATFDDVTAAFTHLRGVDDVVPGRVALDEVTLLGHSAGGQLAMWLALRAERPPTPRVRRVVALAPVADLRDAHRRGLDNGAVAALMGGGPQERPQEYTAADPSLAAPGDAEVEVVVVHGDQDLHVPVEMSRALENVRYVELPGVEHFGLIDPLGPAWPRVVSALSR